MGETLTATFRSSGHMVACSQAFFSAQVPSETMSPVSSAIGMNSLGGTMPLIGWSQRIRASKPLMVLSRVFSTGW